MFVEWFGPVSRRIFVMTDDSLSKLPDDITWYHYPRGRIPMYCDRQGNPISLRRYAELHSDMEYRRVAETIIGDWWVSTVWLGINHQFWPDGEHEPIIFETMPFYRGEAELETLHPELRILDQSDRRYCTEAEAIAGHDDCCIEIRRLLANIEMADEVMREAVDAVRNNPMEGPDA